jgi:hypothetical protein
MKPTRLIKTVALIFVSLAATTFAQQSTDWENISDLVIKQLTDAGTKLPQYAPTAGVAVDRVNGDVYMIVTGIGLWKSSNHGDHFAQVATDQVNGRCEFGYALNLDPAGGRLACFMLDGKCGMSLDAGKTWHDFAKVGRNWDFGAVDWSDPDAKSIFAIHHESGGEVYTSNDAGTSWKFLGKHPEFTAVGIFDANTLVAAKKEGIARSTDGGQSWTVVSDFHPIGRVAVPFNGITWWLAKEGLITSKDKGATWQIIGTPIDAGWGPFFGKDEKQIVVANMKEILQSVDGGQTWKHLADLPPFKAMPPHWPGQFMSIGWDPQANILYASRMGNPTFRCRVGASPIAP